MHEVPVVVVGAGLAGAACARELADSGVPVRVLDRGRQPGGRMSGARLAGREADLGASYLTVDDPGFASVVRDWRSRRLARPWTDSFTVLAPGEEPFDKEGPLRWGASAGLASLVADLLEPVTTDPHEVYEVSRQQGPAPYQVDGIAARAVVLAMPDPQALRVLGPGTEHLADELRRAWEPVIAIGARWRERTWDHVVPGGVFHGAFVNGDPHLAFVADDGRRHGDGAPVLVAHSTVDLAREHLADAPAAAPVMLAALRRLLDLPEPEEGRVHRWAFARPAGERAAPYLLRDGLGVCGDGWGEVSKVQTAWRSGRDLGRALVRELG